MHQNRFSSVRELGSELASKLQAGREAHDDLLASWMAHHIAALIDAAEKATGDAKSAAAAACEQAILNLWKYRETLPRHVRPMVELEPVLRTIASLDSRVENHRYYPGGLRGLTEGCGADVREWLEFAIDMDEVARLLVADALRCAARFAVSRAEPWVELAKRAGAAVNVEAAFVDFARAEETEATEKWSAEERHAMFAFLDRMRDKPRRKGAAARDLGSDVDTNDVGEVDDEAADEADEGEADADEGDEADADEGGDADEDDADEDDADEDDADGGDADEADEPHGAEPRRARGEEERLLRSALAKSDRAALRGRILVIERLLVAATELAEVYRAQLKAVQEAQSKSSELSAHSGVTDDASGSPPGASVQAAAEVPDEPIHGANE